LFLGFYLARFGTWVDKAIAAHDGGELSHVEAYWEKRETDNWFSSSWRDGGTRFKNIDAGSGHWRFVNVPATLEFEDRMYEWCRGELGVQYDMSGCLAVALPWRKQDPTRWFCSEAISAGLQACNLISRDFIPHRTSPNRLYEIARSNWG
jgi:hypothetical protein